MTEQFLRIPFQGSASDFVLPRLRIWPNQPTGATSWTPPSSVYMIAQLIARHRFRSTHTISSSPIFNRVVPAVVYPGCKVNDFRPYHVSDINIVSGLKHEWPYSTAKVELLLRYELCSHFVTERIISRESLRQFDLFIV